MSRSVKWKVVRLIIGLLCVLVPDGGGGEQPYRSTESRCGWDGDYLVAWWPRRCPSINGRSGGHRRPMWRNNCHHPERTYADSATAGVLDTQAQARRWGGHRHTRRILRRCGNEGLIMTYDGNRSGAVSRRQRRVYGGRRTVCRALPYLQAVRPRARGCWVWPCRPLHGRSLRRLSDAANKGRVVLRVLGSRIP